MSRVTGGAELTDAEREPFQSCRSTAEEAALVTGRGQRGGMMRLAGGGDLVGEDRRDLEAAEQTN